MDATDEFIEARQYWQAHAPSCPSCAGTQVRIMVWGKYVSQWKCLNETCACEWGVLINRKT
jgi:hypothetical protein